MSQSTNRFKNILLRLGSMPLAIVLLMVLALASVIGTVLLQNQDQADYLNQFGPVWYWVFRSLGLFDMYHAWWFIGLLGFLMLSLSVCLWHNVPRMLKEMRSRKVTLAERSWLRMEHTFETTLAATDVAAASARVRKSLYDWQWIDRQEEGNAFLRGDKGRYHKWGYILVHTAMLVILIGGWMSVEFGFRGNMAVPEGKSESEISFLKGTSVEYMKMPFEVRCNSFVIDFFPTGAPKEFRSNLTILEAGEEVLTSDIIVNEPLYYKGVRIYQASFGDGGSQVGFSLFHLDGSGRIDTAAGQVYKSYTDKGTGVSLEVTDFKPFNVINMAGRGEPKKFQDLGPSVEYIIREEGLKPAKVKSYMNPLMVNGQNQGSWMQVSITGNAGDYQDLFLGLDLTNPKEWELFHVFLKEMEGRAPEDEKGNLEAFKASLEKVFGDNKPKDLQDTGVRLLTAINTLPQLPWAVLPVLDDYEQIYYTGLQLARDPGMNVVWIGSALLVIGLCIMFYVSHRKLWIVLEQKGDAVHLKVAGMSNRNPVAFDREFGELPGRLEDGDGEARR